MKRRFTFPRKFSRMILIAGAGFWTITVVASLLWNRHQVEQSIEALVAEEARSNFKKDIVYRSWNAQFGGVYVPVTEKTPPNPYLKDMKERDITTPSGIRLTLINPAYMTRLVHTLGLERFGTRGHITSLHPVRPENAADEWEIAALHDFERGVDEVISEEIIDSEPHFRLMRPLVTEKNCLKCHASQGYREGDIRGGISVAVPMSLYRIAIKAGQRPLLLAHLLIWIFGLCGIGSVNLILHRVALARKAEFEHIAAQISSDFVRLAPGKADTGIKSALAMTGRFIGVDRVNLYLFQKNESSLIHTHEWCDKGVSSQIDIQKKISPDEVPWMMVRLKKFNIIHIPVVAELPPDAAAEKKMFESREAKSLIIVPLVLGNRLMGFLGADIVGNSHGRMEEDLVFLQLVGETIIHAIDRDRAERALACQSERLDRILKGTNVGTWEWNIQTGETIVNERWAEIIGSTTKELDPFVEGSRYRNCHPDDRKKADELLQECFERKREFYSCELQVRHKSGEWIWVEDRGKIITWTENGRPEWMYGTRTDISLQKKKEQEQQKISEQLQQAQNLESLGVLAGGIAHDFNNILMGIMGYADHALDNLSMASVCRHNINQVINASKRAAELCNQMLDYAGKGHYERKTISLRRLITETLTILNSSISKKNRLDVCIETEIPNIMADPTQIRQILLNLVINASEAIGDRSGIITISTGKTDIPENDVWNEYVVAPHTPGTYVYFEVSDTGCGFNRETAQHFFEPFFTTKFTGRGLGLSAVLGIVRVHEGALWISSAPEKGATFKVLLPADHDSEDGKSSETGKNAWQGEGVVLLVDDEEMVLDVTGQMLKRMGMHVLTAKDGLEAVATYRGHQVEIDIVLLDMTMPYLNGEETFQELHKINPEVKVVIASGYNEDDITSRTQSKGLAGCLQKPYTLAKLRSLFSRVMSAEYSTHKEKMGVS